MSRKGNAELLELVGKSARMLVRAEDPLNAEPPPDALRSSFITPVEDFFTRNHAPVPHVDPSSYRLRVCGLVQRPLQLSLDDLRRLFPARSVVATLQCAGNRRHELMAIKRIDDEVPWHTCAVGTAEWRGVALCDVLAAAGADSEARHVAFLGLDSVRKGEREFGFGGSIPLEKAMSPEVILAFEMNGAPLRPIHGFPLRVVVPGYIGARSVKWLAQITVQAEPSDNYFQARAYKLFSPHVTADTADWTRGLMLGELSVNAVICTPQQDEVVPAGPVRLAGYALTGGGRTVERVELSFDDGESWTVADLAPEGNRWTWRFWQTVVHLTPGTHQVCVRAWDSAANTQPEKTKHVWNFKGYMNNAWHRVRFTVAR